MIDDRGNRYLVEELVANLNGLRIQIFSREHPPPHFRVTYAGETADFSISDEAKLVGGLSSWERTIRSWHGANKERLIEVWRSDAPAPATALWAPIASRRSLGGVGVHKVPPRQATARGRHGVARHRDIEDEQKRWTGPRSDKDGRSGTWGSTTVLRRGASGVLVTVSADTVRRSLAVYKLNSIYLYSTVCNPAPNWLDETCASLLLCRVQGARIRSARRGAEERTPIRCDST
jgi:hypothetical protein